MAPPNAEGWVGVVPAELKGLLPAVVPNAGRAGDAAGSVGRGANPEGLKADVGCGVCVRPAPKRDVCSSAGREKAPDCVGGLPVADGAVEVDVPRFSVSLAFLFCTPLGKKVGGCDMATPVLPGWLPPLQPQRAVFPGLHCSSIQEAH